MRKINITLCLLLIFSTVSGQNLIPEIKGDTIIYHLSISTKSVNFSGKERQAIAVNNQIPGPTLVFEQGKVAVIYVENKMSKETSVHWHGLLLPNIEDGVPYLNTPPILANTTYKYEFPLKHSGTYWYHSHTNLQEQKGVYGAIIVKPRTQELEYNKELTVVLSDWTDENPSSVMKNLKRHNEWFSIKRNTLQPLIPSIAKGLFKERLLLYQKRMPDMHIADVYYDAFLSNGKKVNHYPDFKPGDKIRIRIINAGASTYFWLNSSDSLQLVSTDGTDVEPVYIDKLLIAIAETYDILYTVAQNGKIEFKASAQDGSGSTSFFIGNGKEVKASFIEKPDYYQLMKKVAILHKKGGHTGHLTKPYTKIIPAQGGEAKMEGDRKAHSMHHKDTISKPMNDSMEKNHNMKGNNEGHSNHQTDVRTKSTSPIMDHAHNMDTTMQAHSNHQMAQPNVTTDFNYDFLKAKNSTDFPKNKEVREVLMNLNANMLRYVWTINEKTLSEQDKIPIKKGEIVRFIMNNNTMMHHPMHLHGHFFRVLNANGKYSPMKHTVDIPPFESMTIEFEANEQADWFFHCHVLYHMMAGMARVVSYDTPRNPLLDKYPYHKIFHHDKQWFQWATITGGSNMAAINYVASNTRNAVITKVDYGWNKNIEGQISYERYLRKYLRMYVGANIENENPNTLDSYDLSAIGGIRYKLLSILDVDLRLDHKLRPEIDLDWHVSLFKRVILYGEYEFKNDFNLTNTLDNGLSYEDEHTIQLGVEYILTKISSLQINYDNRFGIGAGIMLKL